MKIEKVLQSSFILKAVYDSKNKTLDIAFKGKAIKKYRYYDVSVKLFNAFINAESKGTFFGKKIRNKKQVRKLAIIKY